MYAMFLYVLSLRIIFEAAMLEKDIYFGNKLTVIMTTIYCRLVTSNGFKFQKSPVTNSIPTLGYIKGAAIIPRKNSCSLTRHV